VKTRSTFSCSFAIQLHKLLTNGMGERTMKKLQIQIDSKDTICIFYDLLLLLRFYKTSRFCSSNFRNSSDKRLICLNCVYRLEFESLLFSVFSRCVFPYCRSKGNF